METSTPKAKNAEPRKKVNIYVYIASIDFFQSTLLFLTFLRQTKARKNCQSYQMAYSRTRINSQLLKFGGLGLGVGGIRLRCSGYEKL